MAEIAKFMVNEDFFSPEMKSQYCKGLTYTVADDNQKLSALVQRWIKEGKISAALAGGPPAAQIKGKG